MGNEVATKSRTELAQASAVDPFALAGNDMGGSSAAYAKFNGNSGEFTYGSAAEEIEAGEKMAINVGMARKGWICWKESEVVEEIMVPVAQGLPPAESTLTDHGPYAKHEDGTEDGWSAQFAVDIRLLESQHDGAEIVYKTTTLSAMRPLGDLLKQFSREYKNHPGCIPIVEFGKGSYMPKDKKRGKKFFPIFKIVDWMDEAELLATYGEGSRVEEGDDNDNMVADTKAVTKPATTAKAAATKATTKAPAEEDEDEKALRLMAEKVAAKKAAAAKAEAEAEAKAKAEAEAKAKAEAEAAAAAAASAEPEEDPNEDPDERELRLMQEKIAAKKAAAAAAAAAPAEEAAPAGDKPAPTETRTRRRSF